MYVCVSCLLNSSRTRATNPSHKDLSGEHTRNKMRESTRRKHKPFVLRERFRRSTSVLHSNGFPWRTRRKARFRRCSSHATWTLKQWRCLKIGISWKWNWATTSAMKMERSNDFSNCCCFCGWIVRLFNNSLTRGAAVLEPLATTIVTCFQYGGPFFCLFSGTHFSTIESNLCPN